MGWRLPRWGLPLLAKELSEEAARRRTYWIRGVAAGLLLAVFAVAYRESNRYLAVGPGAGPMAGLGTGRGVFDGLVAALFAILYLFVPGMLSGVVTEEKEQGTFPLLLLTGLSPGAILSAKLASRLVPLLTLVALSLPLFAMAYGRGGIEAADIVRAAGLLVLSALLLGAIGLFASTVAPSSLAAFLLAYGITASLAFAPWVCLKLLVGLKLMSWSVQQDLERWTGALFFPPGLQFRRGGQALFDPIPASVPAVAATFVFLALSHYWLGRRALERTSRLLPRLLALLDVRVESPGCRLSSGAYLVRDSGYLLDRAPIAWRECLRRPLGRLSILLRLSWMAAVPLFVLGCGFHLVLQSAEAEDLTRGLLGLGWVLALLVLAGQGAGAFSAERASQTLELLLTSPLAGRDIVRQKAMVLRNTALALSVPLGTLYLLQFVTRSLHYPRIDGYLPFALLCVALYLPLFYWSGLWVGLVVKSRFRAVILAIGGLAAWGVVPVLLTRLVLHQGRGALPGVSGLSLAAWPLVLERGEDLSAFSVTSALWYVLCLVAIRSLVLARADRWLGRA